LDIQGVYRNRSKVLWLNTELFLLHGFNHIPESIGMECLLVPTPWFTRSIQTDKRHLSAITQVERTHQGGQFLWMVTTNFANEEALLRLVDGVTAEAGHRGYFYITASVDQGSEMFDLFKRVGFTAIDTEQAWEYQYQETFEEPKNAVWRKSSPSDISAINCIQSNLFSPAQKWITPSALKSPPDYTLLIDREVQGSAYIIKNNNKAIAIPYYSQSVLFQNQSTTLLLRTLSIITLRLYVLLRGKQLLPESDLLEGYKKASDKRIRMIKHIAVMNESRETEYNHVKNGSTGDVLTPLSKTVEFKDKI